MQGEGAWLAATPEKRRLDSVAGDHHGVAKFERACHGASAGRRRHLPG